MAAKEIKSISVPPSAEEDTINQWQAFGWEFKSTQEVKTQDAQFFTGQDSDGTEHYRTTRGEHYVKLTFERDPSRQNYAELVSLEKQFNIPLNSPHIPDEAKKVGCIWLILSVVGYFLTFVIIAAIFLGVTGKSFVPNTVYLLGLVGPVAIIVWRVKSHSKRNEPYKEAFIAAMRARKDYNANRATILEKALSLV